MACRTILPILCALLANSFRKGECVGQKLVDIVDTSPDFTTLKRALDKASVKDQIINSVLEATVFAPNNAAFEKIARDLSTTVDAFIARADIEDILKYHVVPAFTLKDENLEDSASFTTLLDDNSEQLTIDKHSTPGRVIVVGANRAAYIISPNIEDEKAVAHVIDNVLLPKSSIPSSS
eukprot:jgi/Botrbrau1/18662/Bobra.0849s0002.1